MTTSPTPQELCERLMKWGVCDIPQLLRHDVRTAAATIAQLQARVGELERGWTDVWNANNEGKFHTLTCNASSSGEVVGAPDTGCSCFLGRIIRDQRVNITQLQALNKLTDQAMLDQMDRIAQLQERVDAQQRDIKKITADFSAELKEMRARTIEECATIADDPNIHEWEVANRIRARLALTGVGLSPNPDVRQRPDE